MKTISVWMTMAALAGGMVVVAGALLTAMFVDNLALRRQLDEMGQQRLAAIELSRAAEDRESELQVRFSTLRDEVAALEKQLSAVQAKYADESTAETETGGRARRARVFAGRQPLGEGWLLPDRLGTNAAASDSAVVLLDEAFMRQLVGALTARANAQAEAAKPQSVTVNHHYSGYGGTGWWPVYWWGSFPATNEPPSMDGGSTEPPSRVLPDSRTLVGSGIWRPTEKPFLPNPSTWPVVTPQRAAAPQAGVMSGRVNGGAAVQPRTGPVTPRSLPSPSSPALRR
jgi:hypothetical protein